MALINTTEAAERLGITPRRLRVLIREERVPARKVARDWLIEESDLEQVAERIPGYPKGRPRKRSNTDANA
jgi:excisionase family DNA binding protein